MRLGHLIFRHAKFTLFMKWVCAIMIQFYTMLGYRYLTIANITFVLVFSPIDVFAQSKNVNLLSPSKDIAFHFIAHIHFYVASNCSRNAPEPS